MDKEFEYIELVFENCDYVRLESDLVEGVSVGGIKEWVLINSVGQFIEMWTCEDFEVELKNEALKVYTHWQEADDDGDTFEKHLKTYRDITHINIKTKDKELYVSIPWESDDKYDLKNKLLRSEFDDKTFYIRAEAE